MTCPKQHGYILMPVVILLALVATAAFMLDYESALDSGITSSQLEARQAEYVARAGINHALWRVGQQGCGPYTDLTNEPLGRHSYDTWLTTDLGSTTSYTLAVDQDTWIRSDQPTVNNATDGRLHIRYEAGTIERPMYRYDVSPIPANASILSATAWFYVSAAHPQGPVDIHLLNADWTETDATWDSMGANMDPAVQASIPAQPVAGAWVAVNLTSQVQAWVNGAPNYGITLNSLSEGTHGDYASIETAQKPYMEVIVGTPVSSAQKLKSRATLASGVTRTVNLNKLGLYQQPSHRVLQQSTVKDVMLSAFYNSKNYGDHRMRVSSASGSLRNSMIQFDLAAIPAGARVLSAELELNHTVTDDAGADAAVSVHRVTRDWVEGTGSGGGTADGATWDTFDGSNAWTTLGGEYDPAVIASSPISAATGDWESWNISTLVQDWLDGRVANNGLLLKGAGTINVSFASKEDANSALRPKLSITYACECGSPCLAPQGGGTVLMVVINPTTLVPMDAYKKALLESWGYAVTVVGESSNQAAYDSLIALSDVVLISETVNASQVGAKLQDEAIAVVSQDGIYNDDLGIASGSAFAVASAINVTDANHYITRVFPTGPLEIYDAVMEQLTVSGATAPDLQALADTAGAPSLVVLDKGAIGTGGAPLPGRRVMLPFGRDARFNWDYLNANGRLLLHRALQWGMGADLAELPPKNLLFISGGSLVIEQPSGDTLITPTALEQLRIDLIESWGYAVTLIHHTQSQADFDAALSDMIVAYVSSDVTEAGLGAKLVNAAIGVVNEQGDLVDEFGFGLQSVGNKLRNEVDVIDNTHYITEPLTTGPLTIVSVDQTLHFMTAGEAGGFTPLAQVFNTGSLWDDALGVIESGGALYGGGNAAGRRVLLPWGDASFDVSALNADGQTIMQRAIEWAGGAGAPLAATIWLATLDNVAGSGAPGLADWADGEILLFSEPNLALEPATTNGTFSSILNLDGFASDGNAEIHGLHYVDSTITVGGANSVALQPGDVLITTAGSETLTSNNSISVNNEDVFVFRPASAGDYSAGDFIFLLDGSQIHSETDTVAVSLVEKDTTVGDGVLTAGTFLYATTNRRDVLAFKADDVGAGTTAGTVTTIVEGLDVDLGSEIRGLDLVEDPVMIGGHMIPSGNILLTLDTDGSTAGNNLIAADSEDILYLTMTKIGATSQGDATLLFDGSDVSLDTTSEHLQALTLTGSIHGTGGGGGGSQPPPTCDAAFADDFETDDFTGSTGSLAWSTDWLEVNESDGPGGGDVKVVSHAGDFAGLIKDNGSGNSGEGLERAADLSGYAAATLTYTYWRVLGNNDSVIVEVSNDGGVNWSQLGLYAGPATDADADPQSASYDITPYIGTDTRIRFMTGTSNGNNDGMYFDDVEICLTN